MPRPLQNRVDPWSVLHAIASRAATRMGNRGILHNDAQEIIRNNRGKAWLVCRIEVDGIQRTVFQVEPKYGYSELFFLDEATALAAGHRPCKDCQPYRFREFKRAWCSANRPGRSDTEVLMSEIDEQIHVERISSDQKKVTYLSSVESLPVGAMFSVNDQAFLVTSDGHFRWSFDGYSRGKSIKARQVEVLTPRSVVATLAAGYVPALHPSADS